MNGLKLISTSSAMPAGVVTNEDLTKIVDTSDEWITSRTGIHIRRRCGEGESHTQLCLAAARQALERSGISPEEIGVCLVATFTADHLNPATACILQKELGFPEDTVCFDLNAACSGFVYALHTAQCLLSAAPRKFGLVLGADVLYTPGVNTGAPSYIHMEGQAVFRFAVETVPRCISQVLEQAGLGVEDVDRFVFHQANQRIIDLAMRKLHLPAEKCTGNIAHTGNTSAASVPLLLDELVSGGALRSGQRALCVGFGAGLTWGGALLEVK